MWSILYQMTSTQWVTLSLVWDQSLESQTLVSDWSLRLWSQQKIKWPSDLETPGDHLCCSNLSNFYTTGNIGTVLHWHVTYAAYSGVARSFAAFLSRSVLIATACDCWSKIKWINERMNLAWRGAQSNMEITWHEIGLHTHPISKSWNLFHFDL